MKWLIVLIPLAVAYYTYTYGLWVWKSGNRSGGAAVFFLAAFTLAISVYGIFIRSYF